MPQGAGVVGHQQMELARAFHGSGVHLHLGHVQGAVQAGKNFFHIQNEEHPVLDAQHAGDALARVGLHVFVRRLDAVPGHPVDAGHRGNQKGGLHAAEFGDDDLVVLIAGHFLAEPGRQIQDGQHLAAQIEGAEHRGVMLAGHAGHAGQADDLQHFGDIDAVVPAVGAAVGLLFINENSMISSSLLLTLSKLFWVMAFLVLG